jgi:D-serine deaminase-like pyridoxal phosphate-dependent protein
VTIPKEPLELDQLPSPALVVDLDRFQDNITAARRLIAGTGKTLRPHIKTHKTPELARMQLGDGVIGVTCATVGEAEAMSEAGIDDLLIANEVVTVDKIDRIARLAGRARVIVAVDSDLGVERLEAAASRKSAIVNVLVDVDVGLNRCGVRDMEELLRLTECVLASKRLRFSGLMGYEGRLRASMKERPARVEQAQHSLEEAKATLVSAGIRADVVSGAGTSTLHEALKAPVLTEIQAGTYALWESDLDGLGLPFSPASYVLATVISRSDDVAVLDAGRKSITIDSGPPRISFGVFPPPLAGEGQGGGATVLAVNEEHTVLRTPFPPPLGSRVFLTPSKVPTTFNLHDRVWLVRGRSVERSVPIAARGRSD